MTFCLAFFFLAFLFVFFLPACLLTSYLSTGEEEEKEGDSTLEEEGEGLNEVDYHVEEGHYPTKMVHLV